MKKGQQEVLSDVAELTDCGSGRIQVLQHQKDAAQGCFAVMEGTACIGGCALSCGASREGN